MIDSTVAVQTKGLGFSFQASRSSWFGLLQILDAEECAPTDTLA
jgi:hypothetical protein